MHMGVLRVREKGEGRKKDASRRVELREQVGRGEKKVKTAVCMIYSKIETRDWRPGCAVVRVLKKKEQNQRRSDTEEVALTAKTQTRQTKNEEGGSRKTAIWDGGQRMGSNKDVRKLPSNPTSWTRPSKDIKSLRARPIEETTDKTAIGKDRQERARLDSVNGMEASMFTGQTERGQRKTRDQESHKRVKSVVQATAAARQRLKYCEPREVTNPIIPNWRRS
ncbi:hypothetical protein B0H13DRAFT_1886700 [Mycena leptocephala]|nr:hypothetical protein B0H13DRAFT_1886700 [Mycena leptocephala]